MIIKIPNFTRSYADLEIIHGKTLKTPFIFSFVLFVGPKSFDVFSKVKRGQSLQSKELSSIRQWKRKYLNNQINIFKNFLENPKWQDFCIIWFLSEELFRFPALLENSVADNYTLADQVVTSFLPKYSKRICFIKYTLHKHWATPSYIGSVIRYIPLAMENIDIILFRDAHSTMPKNDPSYGNFDAKWLHTWLTKTKNKYWFYNRINYNAPHTLGYKTIYAAAFGARRTSGISIISPADWVKHFYIDEKTDPNTFKGSLTHGVDERLLLLSFHHSNLFDDVYIVGVLFLNELFYNTLNPRDLYRFYNKDTRLQYTFPTSETRMDIAIKSPKAYYGENTIYGIPGDGESPIDSYWSGLRCFIIASYNISKIKNKSIDTFWKYIIENNQQRTSNEEIDIVYHQMISYVPSRHHMFEYLFERTMGEFDKNDDLLVYVNNFTHQIDPVNSCNLSKYYVIGGRWEYDVYSKKNKRLFDKNHNKINRGTLLEDLEPTIPVFYERS